MSAYIRLHGRKVYVDVRAELERFDWVRPNWSAPNRFIAASPFRHDHTPSFFVNLDEDSDLYGTWADSGATDDEWRSGGFAKLLAFMDDRTYEESVDYLLDNYANDGEDRSKEPKVSLIIPKLVVNDPPKRLDRAILDAYKFRHPYLGDRGISEPVQRLMCVGYDKRSRAVTIPWFNADGSLANVKYRRTDSKLFWYAKGGRPVRELIYGINVIYERRIRRAGIVEGEADAMTLMTAGMPAIATGGATNWNEVKRDIIVRSPLEEVVLYRDNDAAGKAWARRIIADLSPHMIVKVSTVPGRYKDVNEAYLAGVNVAELGERRVTKKFRIA